MGFKIKYPLKLFGSYLVLILTSAPPMRVTYFEMQSIVLFYYIWSVRDFSSHLTVCTRSPVYKFRGMLTGSKLNDRTRCGEIGRL